MAFKFYFGNTLFLVSVTEVLGLAVMEVEVVGQSNDVRWSLIGQ